MNGVAATSTAGSLTPSRVRAADVIGLATIGIRTRRLRSTLTALGIAIGIAALVAVLGISASSRADLADRLNALGTNRLEVQPGRSFLGEDAALPGTSARRIRRIPAVERAAAVTTVAVTVRRSDLIPAVETGGIGVSATEPSIFATIGATVAQGKGLDRASVRLPAVVLGATAAQRLGIHRADGRRVLIGGHWFTVVGILAPIPLYPDLDATAFIGNQIAHTTFGTKPAPSAVYVVASPHAIAEVQAILAATTRPDAPNEVNVTNPSDALAARDVVDSELTSLLLALGGVALLVGGIGIANVMVIGVLERRMEIGVRRALGATRRHVRSQFLLEAVLLGAIGGVLGVTLGALVTAGYGLVQDITIAIPAVAVGAGLGAAVLIGAVAGVSPASRAARLAPADAIRPA